MHLTTVFHIYYRSEICSSLDFQTDQEAVVSPRFLLLADFLDPDVNVVLVIDGEGLGEDGDCTALLSFVEEAEGELYLCALG
jgi:hypothetical protein